MGSTWSVKLVAGTGELAASERDAIDRKIRDQLTRIEGLMSTWDPASELSRFNRSRSLEPFPIARETFEVFTWAVRLARETDGALDVTVLPVLQAWGFGAGAQGDAGAPPDEGTLAGLKESTGIALIELGPDGAWVRKRTPAVECDFSALAPGYAADRLAALLESYDLAGFLIDVGGELVARGRNADGRPWRVAVERPQVEARQIDRVVPLDNVAIATSGDYRNYREVNGRRVGHIIDPRTARPVDHRLASATVVATEGVRADALATALMVLGPDDGLALAHRLDLAVLLLVRTERGFEARTTPRFDELAGTVTGGGT
ncbi:MAG: FAD:protein FMN transferase [Acidimicrobiales bacterium]|nr:FAD:protein FMN transferase [Acidimicrobiales bacterium]